jgi:hypothetical protein
MVISHKATIGAESVVVRKVINFSPRDPGRCKTRICNYFDKNPECICEHKVESLHLFRRSNSRESFFLRRETNSKENAKD